MKNKGIIRLNILTLSFLLLISLIMPFNISAEESTFLTIPQNEIIDIAKNSSGYFTFFKLDGSFDCRGVVINDGTNTTPYIISLSSFYYYSGTHSSSSSPTLNSRRSANSTSYNGVTFYYFTSGSSLNSSSVTYEYYMPVQEISGTAINNAYRFTYGDLAVEESNINYGLLNIGYSTKFVTTNFEGLNDENIDTITWSYTDSYGNFLNGLNTNIEIRAVPNYYIADSAANLLNQTISNLILGVAAWASNGAVDVSPQTNFQVYKGSINRKEFSIKWSDVISSFPNNWLKEAYSEPIQDSINSKFYKTGWIYQVRFLIDEGEETEYISDWQTIYQVTSVAPETSTTIIQQVPNGLSPELYNLLQTVNTLNNTVQNWNINGVPINMQSQQTTDNNKPWYEILLESITSMINTIIEAITGIGGDLINGIFDLVNGLGVNVLDFFTNLWNSLTDMFSDIDIENNEDFTFIIPDNEDLLSLPKQTYNLFVNSGFAFIILIPLVFILIGVIL